jgi:hypothetical protein
VHGWTSRVVHHSNTPRLSDKLAGLAWGAPPNHVCGAAEGVQALRVMWKRVRAETANMDGLDLSSLDEESLLRFLRAHSLDADKAAEAFVDWQVRHRHHTHRDPHIARHTAVFLLLFLGKACRDERSRPGV